MKSKRSVLIVLFFIFFFAIHINTYACDLEDMVQPIEMSNDYKKWVSLTASEKQMYIEPTKYALDSKYCSDRSTLTNRNKTSILYSKLMIANYERYDLRDDITVTVKNQQSTGQCWTFSSNSVIETNIEKTTREISPIFSTRYLEYATSHKFIDGDNPIGYNREVGDGGTSWLAYNFYASGNGPVLESDFPFENNSNRISLSKIQNLKNQKQINEYIKFPEIYKIHNGNTIIYKDILGNNYTLNDVTKIRNSIKEHILQYGAVTAQTYGGGTSNQNSSKYYNNPNNIRKSTAYFCNNSSEISDHQITIIGWDDEYAVENFNSNIQPNNPGAYIVLNSWGNNFGENGVYYISYEDCLIEQSIMGITNVSDINYDTIYQYDNLGNNELSVFSCDVYAGNIFTRNDLNKSEFLNQIAISSIVDSKCDIYVNVLDSELNINKCVLVKKDCIITSGFHTINLDTPLKIEGEKFAVIVKYLVDDNGYSYLPLESPDEYFWKTATGGENRAFLSLDSEGWVEINDLNFLPKNSDLCIKAFSFFENEENVENENDNQNDEKMQYTIKSTKYKIDNDLIYGISPNTNFDEFANNIEVNENYYVVSENLEENKIIYTGEILKIGGKSYKLVVNGDTDGNGMITINDVVKSRLHLTRIKELDDIYLKAMDVNDDGIISITDIVRINLAQINVISL